MKTHLIALPLALLFTLASLSLLHLPIHGNEAHADSLPQTSVVQPSSSVPASASLKIVDLEPVIVRPSRTDRALAQRSF